MTPRMRKATEPLNAGRFRPVIFSRGTPLLSAELPDGYRSAPNFDISDFAVISGSRFTCMNDRQVTTNCHGIANGG